LLSQPGSPIYAPTEKRGRHAKPRTTSHLMIVPTCELTYQIYDWAERLAKDALQHHWDPLHFAQLVKRLTPIEETPTTSSSPALTRPWLMVGTPNYLWEQYQQSSDLLKGVSTLILDEADQLLRLPRKHAPLKERLNRQRHPKPTELLMRQLFGDTSVTKNASQKKNKPQLIACSATINRVFRHHLKTNEWIRSDVVLVDPEATAPKTSTSTQLIVQAPKQLRHHCLIVGQSTIRNIQSKETSEQEASETSSTQTDDLELPQDVPSSELELEPTTNTKPPAWSKYVTKTILESVLTACELDKAGDTMVFIPPGASVRTVVNQLREFGADANELSIANWPSSHHVKAPRIWVTSEYAGRGIDLPMITHVFILGVPDSSASYLHMAGRTARMGRNGVAIVILPEEDHIEERIRVMAKRVGVVFEPFEYVV
jgi:superfamily II DNA/RNA helicase